MVERRFRRDPGALDDVVAFVREFLGQRDVSRDAALDVELITEELFTNVVRHGRGGGPEVMLAMQWSDSTLTLVLRDFDVEPFDVTLAPEPDLGRPLSERRPGGLGIHLVRKMADRLEYDYRDRSSTITVVKRLAH